MKSRHIKGAKKLLKLSKKYFGDNTVVINGIIRKSHIDCTDIVLIDTPVYESDCMRAKSYNFSTKYDIPNFTSCNLFVVDAYNKGDTFVWGDENAQDKTND